VSHSGADISAVPIGQTHRDLRTRIAGAGIKTDTVTASGTVHLDLAGVRLEVRGGVLGGDAALNGKTAAVDVVLGETELLERNTGSDLNLSRDNVDTGDLL
jgi:hypothetical protein